MRSWLVVLCVRSALETAEVETVEAGLMQQQLGVVECNDSGDEQPLERRPAAGDGSEAALDIIFPSLLLLILPCR